MKGPIHWELLPEGSTINQEVYCSQLDRLEEALRVKRPRLMNRDGVILHHDNAKPHTAKMTLEKIKNLQWEVLTHPPYSPDLAPSDYHLFRSLESYLAGKSFTYKSEVEEALEVFFTSKPSTFYKEGIENLVKRWNIVAYNGGEYIID